MKKFILFTIFILVYDYVYSQQYFEGMIVYQNSFKSKLHNLTDQQLQALVGSKQEYFIKGGYYKSYTNGKSINIQLYDYKTNRLYNKRAISDTLYWFDASINSDYVISSEIIKKKEKILGDNCDALVLKTKSGTTTLYYNSKYKINAALFANHNYANWYYFVSRSGAVPLKIVIENKQFVMETVATEIKPMALGINYFDLPLDIPIKQSR